MSRDLDIKLLRAFEAVVRLRSVTRAAEFLNRSQPVVSQQLHKLEDTIGHALFVCDRSWAVTREGEKLLVAAHRILGINDEVLAELGHKKSACALKLGVPEEFAVEHLAIALDKFNSVWPNVPVDVEVNLSRNLLAQLHDGTLDVVLAKQLRLRVGGSDTLWNENLIWVAGKDFVTNPDEPVPLVVFSEACLYRRSAISSLAEAKRRYTIAAQCTNWASIKAQILAGRGVTIASTNFPMDGLREIANDEGYPPLPRISVMLMRADGSDLPAGDYLASCLRETARSGYRDVPVRANVAYSEMPHAAMH